MVERLLDLTTIGRNKASLLIAVVALLLSACSAREVVVDAAFPSLLSNLCLSP